MNKNELLEEIEALKIEYYKSDRTRADASRYGGKISGLRRRELMKARLPILKKIFEICDITPTLNVCKDADFKIFGLTSNFKSYPIYFTEITDKKRTGKDKIYTAEMKKLNPRTQYKPLLREFLLKRAEIDGFFKKIDGIATMAEDIKRGVITDSDSITAMADEHPEALL